MSFRNEVWHDRVRQIGVVNSDGDIELGASIGTFKKFEDAYPAAPTASNIYLVVEDASTGEWASGDAVFVPGATPLITLFDVDESSAGFLPAGFATGNTLICFVDVNTKSMEELDAAVGALQTNDHAPGSDDQVASGVPVTPSGNLTSTNVQAALEELQADVDAGSDDQTALEVPFTPSGTISSTQVQGALEELDSDVVGKVNKSGDTMTGQLVNTGPSPAYRVSSSGSTGFGGNLNSAEIRQEGGVNAGATRVVVGNIDGTMRVVGFQTRFTSYEDAVDSSAFKDDVIPNVKWVQNQLVAGTITYSNVASGLTATDVQAAVDELDGRLDTVESAAGDYVQKSGDTMTGFLTLSADPTANFHAATKQYVDTAVSDLVDTAPGTLDTLNELASALGDDPNFATTVTNQIADKVAKAGDSMQGDLTFDNGTNIIMSGSVGQIQGRSGSIAAPAITVGPGGVRGFYNSTLGTSVAINNTPVATFRNDGTIFFEQLNYETLVTLDNHAVNKKYVDDAIAAIPVDDNQTAAEVPVTPAGNLTSTDVQAALEELQVELDGVGSNVFGTEFQRVASPAVLTTTSTTFQNKTSLNATGLPNGTYRVGVSYQWNHDETVSDFEAEIVYDNGGGPIQEVLHKQEPKDSAGTFGTTGTSQRYVENFFFYVNVAAGTLDVDLNFRTDSGGQESSMWNANIELWRVS